MIQWNQSKSYTFQINKILSQKISFTIVATPAFICCSNTPGKDENEYLNFKDTLNTLVW